LQDAVLFLKKNVLKPFLDHFVKYGEAFVNYYATEVRGRCVWGRSTCKKEHDCQFSIKQQESTGMPMTQNETAFVNVNRYFYFETTFQVF